MSDTAEKESEFANITVDELDESNFKDAFSSTIVSASEMELNNTQVDDNENKSVVIVEQTLTEINNAVSNVEAIDDQEINLLMKAVEESVVYFDCDERKAEIKKHTITIDSQNNCKEAVPLANKDIRENCKRSRPDEDPRESNDDNLKKNSQQSDYSCNVQLNETDINYSRDLFQNDADKTLVKLNATEVECGYNPDYFNYVNRLWGVDSVPDPHRNVTRRFLQNTVSDVRVQSNCLQELNNKRSQISLPVNTYLHQRITRVEERIIGLNKNLQALIKKGSTNVLKNKVLDEIKELNGVVVDMKRDQSEVKHKFEFYKEPYAQKNANFLSTGCVQQLTEQEHLIDFQKKFYR